MRPNQPLRHGAGIHRRFFRHSSFLPSLTAGALPHVHRLSRARSTTRAPPRPGPSADNGPARRHAGCTAIRQNRDGSRVHCESIDEGGAQLYPGSIATPTPQTFTVASQADIRTSRLGVARTIELTGHGAHRPGPYPPDLSRLYAYEGFTHWFLSYSFSSRLPDPDRLAVPARPGVVRAAPTLPGISRIGRVGPADCSAGPPSELLGRLSPQAAQASREGGAGSKRWFLRWRVRSSLRQEACTRRVWSPSGGPGLPWWMR